MNGLNIVLAALYDGAGFVAAAQLICWQLNVSTTRGSFSIIRTSMSSTSLRSKILGSTNWPSCFHRLICPDNRSSISLEMLVSLSASTPLQNRPQHFRNIPSNLGDEIAHVKHRIALTNQTIRLALFRLREEES